jgi:DNA mismatch repair protein MutS2
VHEHVLAKLEYPAILDRLGKQCRFSVAAERARELGPSGDTSTVEYLLDVTAEAVDLLTEFPDVTIGGARDVRNLVQLTPGAGHGLGGAQSAARAAAATGR